jgi:hypothetical protein
MNPDDLITHSRARFDHAAARRLLREKYQARMIFAHAGGLWQATPETMVFLDSWGDEPVVIPDLYHNPVRVQPRELSQLMRQRWQEQMNAWLVEFESSSAQR